MIIGTCSICGGPVTVPAAWSGIIQPPPTCQSCGAVSAHHGQIIEMRPVAPVKYGYSTTSAIKEEGL